MINLLEVVSPAAAGLRLDPPYGDLRRDLGASIDFERSGSLILSAVVDLRDYASSLEI